MARGLPYTVAMRRFLLLVIIGLGSCVHPAVPSDADFARAIDGRVAGAAQSCVATNTSDNLRAIDSMTLAYGSGARVFINRLGASCPGLQDLSTIVIDASSGQYCRGDRIRPLAPGSVIPGPTCNLGYWVPYRR